MGDRIGRSDEAMGTQAPHLKNFGIFTAILEDFRSRRRADREEKG
jgi:hypothetical protein